jgi:hypothetical protein
MLDAAGLSRYVIVMRKSSCQCSRNGDRIAPLFPDVLHAGRPIGVTAPRGSLTAGLLDPFPTGRPGCASSSARNGRRTVTSRGPDPERDGHKAAEPVERHRADLGLVRDRRPGLRAAGLDPATRPDRNRPPPGTESFVCACSQPPADLPGRRTPGVCRPEEAY